MTERTATLKIARMLRELARELEAAELASIKAASARASLPLGSTRARLTTANARWSRAAEHRDRWIAALEAAGVDMRKAGVHAGVHWRNPHE